MLLSRTTAPTVQMMTLTEALDYLHVTSGDEDAAIEAMIATAGDQLEQLTGRAIRPQAWAMSIASAAAEVYLPRLPVTGLDEIAYFDTAETGQTANLSDFYLFRDDTRAWVVPKAGRTWPPVYDRPDAITITFSCGYAEIPADLKHAAKLLVRHYFDARALVAEGGAEVPFQVSSLIQSYVVGWVAA